MLRIIPIKSADILSFPDSAIHDFRYDGAAIRYVSDGVFIEGEGFIEGQTSVECVGVGPAHSRQFVDNEWIDVDPKSGGLGSVHEWSVEHGAIKMAGFGALSGAWQEYVISVESVRVETDIAP
jgi:hypothetical protein